MKRFILENRGYAVPAEEVNCFRYCCFFISEYTGGDCYYQYGDTMEMVCFLSYKTIQEKPVPIEDLRSIWCDLIHDDNYTVVA